MSKGGKILLASGIAAIAVGAVAWEMYGVFFDNTYVPTRAVVENSAANQPGRGRGWGRGFGRGNFTPPPANHLTEVPELEEQRAAASPDAAPGALEPAAGDVRLTADFECAFVPKVSKLSDTHFVLDFENKGIYWWMFRLTGAAGKSIRVDLKNVPLDKWCTLNPLYQYADGAVPAISLPLLPDDYNLRNAKTIDGHNGTRMPDTSGDPGGWHFIPEVWSTSGSTLSFIQRYEKDDVKVAMRVPFTLSDEAALVEMAREDTAPPDMRAQVIDVGTTPGGRTLHVVKLSSGGEEGEKEHPCILMYAREHADEQDSSWPVAGALKWLLADAGAANDVRKHFTFMFIPILDMDLAAKSGHENVIRSFLPRKTTPESLAYGSFFEKWMQKGNALDVVFDLHNMESAEGSHLVPPLFPPADSPLSVPTLALHSRIRNDVQLHGFGVGQESWNKGYSPERLGGWLENVYGTVSLPYEANMQDQGRHLLAAEEQVMGAFLARAADDFLSSDSGKPLLALSRGAASKYEARWVEFASLQGASEQSGDLFAIESRIKQSQESRELLDAVLGGGESVK